VIIAITCILAIVVIVFVLGVRPKDLPEPEPVSPFAHLDERKAAIYENLRDLQFEYRVGKLSDNDYQLTKKDLQKELASVMAEVDRVKAELGVPAAASTKAKQAPAVGTDALTCPHCNARFAQELKFCGECGKPMKAVRA
jgi:rRNA maturation endonuclease Nob1